MEKETGWFDSELTCQKFDGHLVSVGDSMEDKFLRGLGLCRNQFWLGMVIIKSRDWQDTAAWHWWDGTNHTYTQLHTNPYKESAMYKNCVYHTQNTIWEPDHCRKERKYVCKAPIFKSNSVR